MIPQPVVGFVSLPCPLHRAEKLALREHYKKGHLPLR